MAEMENDNAALRAKVAELEAENARLKATRAAFYKMYIESTGNNTGRSTVFTRLNVFKALQLSADEEETAPRKQDAQKPNAHWKAEWGEKAKQRLLRADGTPKTAIP